MLLVSGSSSVNSLMPKFESAGIKVWNYISGDVSEEAVLLFNECDIHKVHKIVKILTMGSNQQLKDQKEQLKAEKERVETKRI